MDEPLVEESEMEDSHYDECSKLAYLISDKGGEMPRNRKTSGQG